VRLPSTSRGFFLGVNVTEQDARHLDGTFDQLLRAIAEFLALHDIDNILFHVFGVPAV
jgi:hypothetical protein